MGPGKDEEGRDEGQDQKSCWEDTAVQVRSVDPAHAPSTSRKGGRSRGQGSGSTWSVLEGSLPSEARRLAGPIQELRSFSGFQ